MYLNQNYICQSCNARRDVLTVQDIGGPAVLKTGICPCPCGGMIIAPAARRRTRNDGEQGHESDYD